MVKSKVYFTKEITPASLVRIFEKLGVDLPGKVGVKISTGEPGGHNYLKPELIKELVQKVNGTIVECNTAYEGGRNGTEQHLQAARDHGFTAIAEVDIMDADGDIEIPIKDGRLLEVDIVGKHMNDYDSFINLAHFKGHQMGGFGGVLKNQSIGFASSVGKTYIHTAANHATLSSSIAVLIVLRIWRQCFLNKTIFLRLWPNLPRRWQTIWQKSQPMANRALLILT